MHLLQVGADALLVEVAGPEEAAALAAWARSRESPDVAAVDVVPAATTVLFDGVGDMAALRAVLDAAPDPLPAPGVTGAATGGSAGGSPVVEVTVTWDGPDLAFVADHWQVDVADAVGRLESTELVSAFCGFAPGFAYLAGLPTNLAVPRLDTPRSRVEPGSVALADRWCGIYPTASPGGWRLVGRTDAALWDPGRSDPALLAPGTRVRLVGA